MTLRMRVLPRFPATINGINGLIVVRDTGSPDLTIKPDFGSLAQIPSVSDGATTFFIAWDQSIDAYRIMSFDDLFAGVAGEFLPLIGGTMAGAIDMGSHKITSLTDGSAAGDAVNKGQLDESAALKLSLTGGTMSGVIAMGSQKITGLADGTNSGDAVNKGQLDLKLNLTGGTLSGNLNVPSINGGPIAGLLNKLINPRFNVNQPNASASLTLGASAHWYDGWKAGASGCTLSVTAGVVTITAGALVQVVDGNDLETGTHVINWTGTATCTVDGVAKTKGQTASLTRGTNCTVSFGTGTLSFPQLEPGSVATAFEQRPLSLEEALCQTRYELVIAAGGGYQPVAGVAFPTAINYRRKRGTPVFTVVQSLVSNQVASAVVDSIQVGGARYLVTGSGSSAVSVSSASTYSVDARL